MRLTNSDRKAFVKAVMQDVPEIDYDALIQKAFEKWFVTQLPPVVAAVYTSSERNALDHRYIGYHNERAVGVESHQRAGGYFEGANVPDALMEQLKAFNKLRNEQSTCRDALEANINAVINGCNTLKTAKERLPEFEKYLPADRDGTGVTNLPAISNLVADLVLAGWPKNQSQGV